MEFRHLVSFLAIAEEAHFGRAARRLNLTQPSLSQHLVKLERDVGVQLVARTSREVGLTPAGHAFRAEARRILELRNKALELTRETAAGRAGRLNIGFNRPAGQRILPAMLGWLQSYAPHIHTKLWERQTGPQINSLLRGELDVGFISGVPPTSSLQSKELMRVRIVGVVGGQHEWAQRDQVSFRELDRQPCLLFRRSQCPALHDTISTAAEQASVRLRIVAVADDHGAGALLLTTHPMVAFASEDRASAMAGAHAVPLVDPVPSMPVHVVWRRPRSRLVDELLAGLEHAAEAWETEDLRQAAGDRRRETGDRTTQGTRPSIPTQARNSLAANGPAQGRG